LLPLFFQAGAAERLGSFFLIGRPARRGFRACFLARARCPCGRWRRMRETALV